MLSESALTALSTADPVLRFALYSSIGLVLLTLLVMVHVLVLSERAARRARRRAVFNRDWRERFAACSLGTTGDAPAPRPARGDRLWFLLQWNRFQVQLRGTARERMNGLLAELGLDRFALELLASRRTRSRLVALATLRHIGDTTHWDAVQTHLASDNASIALAAAQALVAMDAERAMRLVLGGIGHTREWAIARIAGLCRQAGARAVTPALLDALEAADPTERSRLARLIAFAEAHRAAPWARRILASGSSPDEMRAALRCLQDAADPRDRASLEHALTHPDPDIRLAALQAFRRIASLDDAPRLLAMLGDRSWWVRQTAADALLALPGATETHVSGWLDATEDAYGRDALTRAIAEGKR